MTDETHGEPQDTREPYTIDEKRGMLVEAATSKEAADAIGELTDEQVETAFEEHLEAATAEDGPLPQPPEAREPSTGSVIEQDDPPAVGPDAPKPTIGRIVLYTVAVGRSSTQVVSVPALVTGTVDYVTKTWPELDSGHHVHLTVFEPGRDPISATNVPWDGTGVEYGTWRWPERV